MALDDFLAPTQEYEKENVNYRPYEKCSTCSNFRAPNLCKIVKGTISPDAVCDKWTILERHQYNKAFFEEQIRKERSKE